MKAEQKSKINPFKFHSTKEKFSVLGRKPHHPKSRPGHSRGNAIELRKNTLLKEYKNCHKTSHFKDRRIGENDSSIDAEKKIMLRLVAAKKKEAKRSMFNLDDNEVLTHKGEPLNEANMQDVADFSDEEQSDDSGNIDGDYVATQHFGGGLFSRGGDKPTENKSRKEWIDEIIVESKKKKLALKEEKSMQEEAVAEINEAYSSYLKRNTAEVLTKEEKDESKKKCDFSSYDKFYLELTQDDTVRANPSDRLMTKEELDKEHEEKMKVFEAGRKQRMRNAFEEEEDKLVYQGVGKSADALGDSFKTNEPTEEEPAAPKAKKVSNTPVETENVVVKVKEKKRKVKKKFLKNYEVPDEFEEFWEILKGFTPAELAVIIGKLIENNHPTMGKPYEKSSQIFAFLLQTLEKLCIVDAESLTEDTPAISYCQTLMSGLFQLVHLAPATSTNIFNEILRTKFRLCSKTNFKEYPFTDTFIFLRLAGMLYPASDFEHDVITPIHVFMSTLLGWAKIRCKRDVVAMFFTTNLLYEYIKPAKRFSAELLWGFKGLLYMALPKSEEKSKLEVHNSLSTVGPKSQLLFLSKSKKKFESTTLIKFSLINDNSDNITNKFKLLVIAETLKLLLRVIESYSKLSIAKVVFQPIQKFVDLLPIDLYPSYVKDLQKNVISAIKKLSGPGNHLAITREKVQPITFYEPHIEEVKDSKWQKNNPQEEIQRQKLAHKRERKATKREIKKDFQCIAEERLKETIARDTERKRKVNTIMRELGTQEGEFQRYKKMKK